MQLYTISHIIKSFRKNHHFFVKKLSMLLYYIIKTKSSPQKFYKLHMMKRSNILCALNSLTFDYKMSYIVSLKISNLHSTRYTLRHSKLFRYLVRRINRYATVKGISNEAYVYRFENAHFAYWTRYIHTKHARSLFTQVLSYK